MDFAGQRETLVKWAENKGDEGVRAYWREKNALSFDGLADRRPRGLTLAFALARRQALNYIAFSQHLRHGPRGLRGSGAQSGPALFCFTGLFVFTGLPAPYGWTI